MKGLAQLAVRIGETTIPIGAIARPLLETIIKIATPPADNHGHPIDPAVTIKQIRDAFEPFERVKATAQAELRKGGG